MSYTNGILNHDDSQGLGKVGTRGLPGIGFKLDANNDYDMQNKKLVNVKQGTNNNDVVTKSQLDSEIAKIPSVDTSKFMLKAGDTMTGSLIVPKDNYPVHGNLNKVISYESQREIFLSKKEGGRMEQHIDMGGSNIVNLKSPTASNHASNKAYVDNSVKNKADLSKTATQTFQGRVQVPDFNSGQHNGSDIVNLRYIDGTFLNKKTGGTLSNPISFLSSLPNNQKQIHSLGTPQYNSSAANKQYVDNSVKNKADLSKTTTQTFQGRIQVPDFDPSSHSESDIVNLKDINDAFLNKNKGGVMKNPITFLSSLLNNQKQINNLGTPQYTSSAANKSYVDETLAQSHIDSSNKKNAFKYLLDADESSSENNIVVIGISDFAQSPHKNKLAYKVGLQKNPNINDYQSKIGFSLYPLSIGKFTSVLEYYPLGSHTNIQLSAQATTANIHKTIQKSFSDHVKILVQFNNGSRDALDYIYFNLHGSSTLSSPQAFLIIYGVKDWQDTVNPEVYDYDHNNHVMRIVKYTNKIISNIAWLTDGPWQDLSNYYVNFNYPTVGNIGKLVTYLQVSNDKNGGNLWCRWVANIINPVTKNVENTRIIQVNTTSSILLGNRFRSGFGIQLAPDYENIVTLSNASFFTVVDKNKLHKFQLQVRVTDGGTFTVNSIANNINADWNSYTVSIIEVQEIAGLKLDTNSGLPADVITFTSE